MRTKNSIKNMYTIIISNIVSFIFLFITQTVFIKTLGIEYLGLNGLFSNILTLLSLFELGIGNAIVFHLYKYISKKENEKIKSIMKYYRKAYNYIIIAILSVGLLFLPFITFIVKVPDIDINIYVVYLLFLLGSVSSYILAYKKNIIFASQKNYILNIIHILYIITLNISEIIIIILTKNYYLYLILKVLFNLLENIVISIKSNKEYPILKENNVKELDKKTKEDIISRIKAIFIHKLSAVVTKGTDNILISIFLGIKTVGLYTSYNYVINFVESFFKSILSSTTASVGNLLVEEDYNKRYIIFRRINFLNYWIAIVTGSLLLFLLQPFITIWIGKKYLLSIFVLVVLIILFFITMMRSTYNIFKDAAGIWREDKYIPIVQLTINLISSIIILKLIGLAGVFIGTILSTSVLWFYSYPKYVYKKILNKSYKVYSEEIIKHLLLFIIIEVIIYSIINLITINNIYLLLIIRFILVSIISNILLLIIYSKTEEYKYYKNIIISKIKRKA